MVFLFFIILSLSFFNNLFLFSFFFKKFNGHKVISLFMLYLTNYFDDFFFWDLNYLDELHTKSTEKN